jgi:hypothetical protein
MTDKKLREVQELLAELRTLDNNIDEAAFNIGVDYGRYLQKENLAYERLNFFIDRENLISDLNSKRVLINDLRQQLGLLLYTAIVNALNNGFVPDFNIDVNELGCKFPSDISEKYKIQHLYSEEREGWGNYDLAFELTDEFKSLLERFNTEATIKFFVQELTLPADYKTLQSELRNSGRLSFSARHCPMTLKELEAIVEQIKEHVFKVC